MLCFMFTGLPACALVNGQNFQAMNIHDTVPVHIDCGEFSLRRRTISLLQSICLIAQMISFVNHTITGEHSSVFSTTQNVLCSLNNLCE